MNRTGADIVDIEIDLFLEALFRRHGYDFRHYAKASIRRRVLGLVSAVGAGTVLELMGRTLYEPTLLPEILAHLSVPVTEMFRDSAVFKALRKQVVPVLASWPRLRI